MQSRPSAGLTIDGLLSSLTVHGLSGLLTYSGGTKVTTFHGHPVVYKGDRIIELNDRSLEWDEFGRVAAANGHSVIYAGFGEGDIVTGLNGFPVEYLFDESLQVEGLQTFNGFPVSIDSLGRVTRINSDFIRRKNWTVIEVNGYEIRYDNRGRICNIEASFVRYALKPGGSKASPALIWAVLFPLEVKQPKQRLEESSQLAVPADTTIGQPGPFYGVVKL